MADVAAAQSACLNDLVIAMMIAPMLLLLVVRIWGMIIMSVMRIPSAAVPLLLIVAIFLMMAAMFSMPGPVAAMTLRLLFVLTALSLGHALRIVEHELPNSFLAKQRLHDFGDPGVDRRQSRIG